MHALTPFFDPNAYVFSSLARFPGLKEVSGAIMVHLPFADNLALNLQALGLLLAPCSEFAGGAWAQRLLPVFC